MLTKKDWLSAIDVQDACNLQGVVNSLASLFPKIRAEAEYLRKHKLASLSGEYISQHPIVILYVSKIMHLSGMQSDEIGQFAKAYEAIQAKLAEPAAE